MRSLRQSLESTAGGETPEWIEKGVAALTSVATLAATVLGGLAAAGGGAGRMFRNEGALTYLSLTLFVFAVFVVAVALLAYSGSGANLKAARTRLLAAALALVLGAFLFGFLAIGRTLAAGEVPAFELSLSPDDPPHLEGTVSVASLPASEPLFVRVVGLPQTGGEMELLASVVTGGREDTVALPIDIALPDRSIGRVRVAAWVGDAPHACSGTREEARAGASCATLTLPIAEAAPMLDFKVESTDDDRVLSGTIESRTARNQVLHIVVRRGSETLYETVRPGSGEAEKIPITLPIGASEQTICIVAELARSDQALQRDCPPSTHAHPVGWLAILAPGTTPDDLPSTRSP